MEDPRLTALKGAIAARGWRWRPGKPIPYGEQLFVSDGVSEASLDFYPKRGRCVVGGAGSSLRQALSELVAPRETGNRLDHERRETGRRTRKERVRARLWRLRRPRATSLAQQLP